MNTNTLGYYRIARAEGFTASSAITWARRMDTFDQSIGEAYASLIEGT